RRTIPGLPEADRDVVPAPEVPDIIPEASALAMRTERPFTGRCAGSRSFCAGGAVTGRRAGSLAEHIESGSEVAIMSRAWRSQTWRLATSISTSDARPGAKGSRQSLVAAQTAQFSMLSPGTRPKSGRLRVTTTA